MDSIMDSIFAWNWIPCVGMFVLLGILCFIVMRIAIIKRDGFKSGKTIVGKIPSQYGLQSYKNDCNDDNTWI